MTPFYRKNLGLKLTSLLLAYIAWAFVVSRSPGVRFVKAPVDVTPPEGMVVTDYSPKEVQLRLEGDAPLINRLSEGAIYARVPVDAGLKTGKPQKVAIREKDIQGAPAGAIKEFIPNLLTVILEPRVAKTVPVKVRVTGAPPPGYKVYRILSEPSIVEISGPPAALRSVREVQTDEIHLTKRTRPAIESMGVSPADTQLLSLLQVRPEQVQVSILVDASPRSKSLDLPVVVPSRGFVAEPNRVRVKVEGPPAILNKLPGKAVVIAEEGGDLSWGGFVTPKVDFHLPYDESARLQVQLIDPGKVRLKRLNP